jgi:energy-coupling factor transporter ATP-binding protein EcfA2
MMLRKAFTDALKGFEQGRYDFAPTIATLQEAQTIPQSNASTLEALDAIEFFEMAEQDERTWLLDRWICEGSLHLFAGQKKIGKSTLLHSMIGSLMTGQDWFEEIGCQQAPVVYLDFENPADYVKSNLLQMMPRQDYEPVRKWLRVPKSLPSALTGEWLMRFLDHNNLTAYSSGVIFIDSARRAFNGLFPDVSNWENNASEVSRCMQPMLKIARDTNFAVVIIHHDNKSNDSAGSVDWEAVSDFVWHYTASGTDRILSSKHGRYVGREPESMVFRKPEDRLQLAGLAGDIRAQQSDKKRQSKLDELVCDVVPHIPELDLGAEATETNTVTVRDLIEKTGKSRDVLQKELRSLRIEGVVQSGQMKPGKNKPLHYWRNNQALS